MAGLYDNYVQTDNIFKGQAPTIGGYDWGSAGGGTDWGQTPGVDWGGSLNLPGLSGTGALGSRSDQPDWLSAGVSALNKALAYKQQNSGYSNSKDYRGYASNAGTAARGRGYTMYMPGATQKTTQSGGRPGVISSIASIAAPIAGIIPGGQVAAGLLAAGGRAASMFGA